MVFFSKKKQELGISEYERLIKRLVEAESRIKVMDERINDIMHKFNAIRGQFNRKFGNIKEEAETEKPIKDDGFNFLRKGVS